MLRRTITYSLFLFIICITDGQAADKLLSIPLNTANYPVLSESNSSLVMVMDFGAIQRNQVVRLKVLIPPGMGYANISAQASYPMLTSSLVGVTRTDPCNSLTQLCDLSQVGLTGTPSALGFTLWDYLADGIPTEPLYIYFIYWLTNEAGGTYSFSTYPTIRAGISNRDIYNNWLSARPWANLGGTGNIDGINDTSSTTRPLTVATSPNNAGSILCNSTTCQSSYTTGTTVTLTAIANTGYKFSSWSGGCSGTSATATVTLTQSVSCTANFSVITTEQKTLTIQKTGGGTGTVQSIFPDSRINCGTSSSSCTASFDINTNVTLSATPATNSTFAGWENCTNGQVTLSENKTCIAKFTSSTLPTVTLSPLKLDGIYQFSKIGNLYPLSSISIPQNVQMGFSGLLGNSITTIKSIDTMVTTLNGNKTLLAKAGDFIFLDALIVPTTTLPIEHTFLFMALMGENGTSLFDANTIWLKKASEYSVVTDSSGSTTQTQQIWESWTPSPTLEDLKFDTLSPLQPLAQDNGVRLHVGSGLLSSFRLPSGFVVKDIYFFPAYKTNGTYILGEPLVVEMEESEQFVDTTTLQMARGNSLTILAKSDSSVTIKSCTLNNPSNAHVTLQGCTIAVAQNAVVGSSFVVEVDGDGGQFNTVTVTIK